MTSTIEDCRVCGGTGKVKCLLLRVKQCPECSDKGDQFKVHWCNPWGEGKNEQETGTVVSQEDAEQKLNQVAATKAVIG